MIFYLPQKEDRKLLYELYYIHGICFGALMGPKEKREEIQFKKQTTRENIPSFVQRVHRGQICETKKTESLPSVSIQKQIRKESFQWTRIPTQHGGKIQPNRSVMNRKCNQL